MNKCIRIMEFAEQLFDQPKVARQAGAIMQAILACQSPRISDIASRLAGRQAAAYKRVQRFLQESEPKQALRLLLNEQAEFVIGDPTEIERPHARKTSYVGTLKDGKTRGFQMLTLATPIRGRALPFHFLTYSSQTFEEQVSSRNLEHFKAIQEIRSLLNGRPIVFDREFSYCELLNSLVEADIHFVIRLNLGSNPPHFFYDREQKRRLHLSIAPLNKPKIYRRVYYMGQVRVNLIGIWQYGFKSPLWIITNLDPESGLALYQQRMKIEICFRDLKSLLQIDKVMNKSQANLEKILALVMLAYAVSVLVGEAIRDVLYAQVEPAAVDLWDIPPTSQNSHWHLFSGPFLLIKKRYRLPRSTLRQIVAAALRLFRQLVHGSFVRSFVPT